MARNIKRIAHDLLPLSDAVTELSSIISQLLEAIQPHTSFDDPSASKYFEECTKASEKLALSSQLIRKCVQEINDEADNEGISKD